VLDIDYFILDFAHLSIY